MPHASSEHTLVCLLCLCLTQPGFSETHPLQRPTGQEALEHNTLNVPLKGATRGPGGCKSLHAGDAIPRPAPDKGERTKTGPESSPGRSPTLVPRPATTTHFLNFGRYCEELSWWDASWSHAAVY